MLIGIALRNALREIVREGRAKVEDIADAIQVMELAENFGRSVVLVQGEDRWELLSVAELTEAQTR
jgi:hypothetical protein